MHIADLHIHSRYSHATSRDCDAPHLDLWARRKGIALLGTGDCTHAGWRAELSEQLCPAADGLYTLRRDLALPEAPAGEVPHFVVSGEISSIYKKGGKVRRVHNIVLFPSLEDAERLSGQLERIGNIHADGRPILKLDCRDLVEMTLNACPSAMVIPAHIWTPHFSVFGAFSDFHSMEECFGDMTAYIHALETGLSSDPAMNGRLGMLDRYLMLSNSDAHSPAKLGREANLLDIDLTYTALHDTICGRNPAGLRGTIEFFPEEGKYHLDGHRACGVCLTPAQTRAQDGRCPVCGGKLTVGVLHRLESLADRPANATKHLPFESLAPLPEVLASSLGISAAGVRVKREYLRLLDLLGPELFILREASLSDVRLAAGERVAEGLRRLRAGEVIRKSGFDGQYGVIELFSPAETDACSVQVSLFGAEKSAPPAPVYQLDREQAAAVQSTARVTAVAGASGTGKTETIAARIAHMIGTLGIRPAHILAVVPTAAAAQALRSRVEQLLGKKTVRLRMDTLPALALARRRARDQAGMLLAPDQCIFLAKSVLREAGFTGTPEQFLQAVSVLKNGGTEQAAGLDAGAAAVYDWQLHTREAFDRDDLFLDEIAQKIPKKPLHVLADGLETATDTAYRLLRAWSAQGTLFASVDTAEPLAAAMLTQLQADAPDAELVRLSTDRKHTPAIVHALQNVRGQTDAVTCLRTSDVPVRLVHAKSTREEAHFIVRDIGRCPAPAHTAVLCRTAEGLPLLERALTRAGIPCAVRGLGTALRAPRVHAALSLLRFLHDQTDAFSLRSYLRILWKLSGKQLDRACDALQTGAFPPELDGNSPFEQPFCAVAALYPVRETPAAFFRVWETVHGTVRDTDLLRLASACAAYTRTSAFLADLQLGTPAAVPAKAVTLAAFADAQHDSWQRVYLCGLSAHTGETEADRALFSGAMACARDALVLVTGTHKPHFLDGLTAVHTEHAAGAARTETGSQLALLL